jgi:putative endopeptidase
MKHALTLLLVSFSLACSAADPAAPAADAEHYLDSIVDRSADPRQDFFQYAVGKWLKDNPIPGSERSWGVAHVVQDETYRRLVLINEDAVRDTAAAKGSAARKIGDFWFAAMDLQSIDEQGLLPLGGEFERIALIKTRPELLAQIARLQHMGVEAMMGMTIFQDEKDSEQQALHLYQGGLGLPNRDYYFDKDVRSATLRAEYTLHLERIFGLLGDAQALAKANAAAVMALETEMARASRKLEALRDPQKNYRAYSVDALDRLTPSIRWRQFLQDGSFSGVERVIVGQPEFFANIEKLLVTRPLQTWKTYLRWQLAHAFAYEAGGAYEAETFHFYDNVMNGTKEQRPRWKRMLDQEERYLGDALGELYVKNYFPPSTKARYERLTDEVFAAFRERIAKLVWMSEPTRQRALRKLASVTRKIGYPERFKDYSAYEVTRGSFIENVLRGRIWQSDYAIAKLGKPVDRSEWDMTPQTYNAYYNPSNNEIVMPAAVFALPGIEDPQVDDALVYGYAAGTTIGHEITHGFDDSGRQFDEKGNLKTWWTAADDAEFKRRARVAVNQFGQYRVGDLHVNGDATQGENIADIGGIALGYDAFMKTEQFKRGTPLGGFTPTQRYYIGWALGWMNQTRPEAAAIRVKTDVHSPSFVRVLGPVSNQAAFQEAFGVKPGDKMYRAEATRVKIW